MLGERVRSCPLSEVSTLRGVWLVAMPLFFLHRMPLPGYENANLACWLCTLPECQATLLSADQIKLQTHQLTNSLTRNTK